MAELDIETLKRDLIWISEQPGFLLSRERVDAIIAALEDREILQERYAEQTADFSRLSERYEELLDKLEKYGYMEGIEAALEDRERLRAAVEKALMKFEEWEEHGIGVKDGIAILRYAILRDIARTKVALEGPDG